ncbi:PKD-like domain-containing protein, partial [Lacihabitans sp. CCS-44]|uniref:PKD-like domain-containing protein n=1 Tax=Lacihabitans sp. CCS-44 TaxID=2487331 RepID=UPI0020CD7A24
MTLFRNRLTLAITLAWAFFVFADGVAKDLPKAKKTNIVMAPPPINFGGEISGDEANNGGFDPSAITNVSAPTGTGGTVIEYLWQSSTDGITWSNIGSSNSITYNPGAITVTTYYRRLSKFDNENFPNNSGNVEMWNGVSNVISKIITNYSITSPSAYTIGQTINLTQTGSFANNLDNLVPEGHIPLQPSQFLSDYTYNTTGTASGVWDIDYSFDRMNSAYNSNFSNTTYNNEGFMLLFNGANTSNRRAWYKTITVVAGNVYYFSARTQADNNTNQPQLQWNINGTNVGTQLTVSNSSWQTLSYTYTAASSGTIVIAIVNNRILDSGNNFAIDDIKVVEDEPITYLWTGPNGFTSTLANPNIPNAQLENSGDYTLTITKGGLSVTITKNIWVSESSATCIPPTFTFTSTNPACFGSNTGVINITNPIGYGGLGNITYQTWTSIPGTTVSSLTTNSNYPNNPSSAILKNTMEGDINGYDNIGGRLVGYIIPRTTGSYTFWISSDDNGELWLSTDSNPANRVKIAEVLGYTDSKQWNKYASQKSVAISLTAGQKYYIEAIYKEGTGGDNIAIGWAKPGQGTTAPSEVIPGTVLRPYTAAALAEPVFEYSIDGTNFQTASSFNGLTSGTYTITLRDKYGCTATSNVTLTAPAQISTTTSNTSPVCQGSSFDLSATSVSGATAYSWTYPSGSTNSNRNHTISSASASHNGIFTLTVTVGSCSATFTTNVTIKELPSVPTITSTNPNCGQNDGTITFNFPDNGNYSSIKFSLNGNADASYLPANIVNDNIGSHTITGVSAGTKDLYVRWGTDECPFDLPNRTLVSGTTLAPLSMSPNITTCKGNTVSISGTPTNGLAPYIYSWSNGLGSTSSVSVSTNSSNVYTLTVRDSNSPSCTATAAVAVNVVDSPGVTITTPDSLICVNGVSTISSTIDIAGTYTYQWQTSPNGTTGWANISGQTNSTFTNSFLVAGSYFYRVIVSGSAQCNDGTSNAFQIRVVSSPTATVVAPSNTTCIGTQATLSASVSNGAGSITYQWQQSANGTSGWTDISGQTGSTFAPPYNAAGTFYFRVIATMSAAGCSYAVSPSYTFLVVNPATVTVTPANTSLCIGATQILTTNVTGASGTYSILWQESNNNSAWWNVTSTSSATLNTNNDSLELAYFRPIIDFSVCGIYHGTSVQIQTNPIHTVDASLTNGTVCVGGSTQLNGIVTNTTGTVTYQWQTRTSLFGTWNNVSSGGNLIDYTPSTSTAGLVYYRLNVTTSGVNCGTISSPSLTLNIVPQATVTIAASSGTICLNGNYTITSSVNNGVGPFTYQWQRYNTTNSTWENIAGQTNSSLPIPTSATGITNYRIIVNSSGNGCSPATSAQQTIDVLPLPTVTASNTSNSGGSANACVGTLVLLKSGYTGALAVTSYSWSHSSGFSSGQQNPTSLISSASSGGVYTVTGLATNGCTNTMTTSVTVNTNCNGMCSSYIQVTPLNPTGCNATDGGITVNGGGVTNYETSLDGIAWTRGNFVYGGQSVGTKLVFIRDWTSKIICRTVNITLVSIVTSFYTGETVTNATGCFNNNGRILLAGVNPTDQVTWISSFDPVYTTVQNLSPANTITGLLPGSYYVRVTRGGEYCYSERIVTVGNSGTPCISNAVCSTSGTTPNLFPNGDFGSGTDRHGPVLTPLETQYGYSFYTCNSPNDGFYSVVNNMECNGPGLGGGTFGGSWQAITEDHTTGDTGGYMMVVNASHNKDIVIEKEIGGLCPNTQYNFTAWIRDTHAPGYTGLQPDLAFLIDGVIQYRTNPIAATGTWVRVGFSFKTGSTVTSAVFSIKNNQFGGGGNDWIIDDIVVDKCPLNITLDGESVACLGGTNETINATITDPNREHDYYKWQESNDNGTTWQDVTGVLQGTFVGNDMNVTINLPTPIVSALSGKLYRIRLATTATTVGDPICSVVSQISKVIVPPVAVSVTPPLTICYGTSASLTATGSGGTTPYTYTWTNTAATGGTVSVSPTTSTVYTVTARDVDNCSATATTSVSVTPVPTASALAQTSCSGDAFSVAPTTNIVGTTYTWTVALISGTASGFSNQASAVSGPISQTLINSTTTSAVVRYTVTPYNGVCPGANFTFDVTVRPSINITNPGPQTICSATSFSRTPISNITGTQYTWTAAIQLAPSGGTITGFSNNTVASNAPITQTLTNSGTSSGVVRYTVTPIANGCNGTPFTFDITVQPTIVITNPGPQTICSATSFSRTPISNITTTTYTWTATITTAPTGGTITGFADNGTASAAPITQILTNSGTTNGIVTYTVTPVANGCNGTPFTFAITVQPTMVIANPGPETICSGASFSRTPTSNIVGTTYTWTAAIQTAPTSGTITGFSDNAVASAAPISQTLTNSGTTNGIVRYTVTPVTAGCTGTPFTIDITVQPTIVITNPGPQTICSGTSFSRTPISNIGGTTYTWTAAITTAPTGGTITGFSDNAVAASAPISQTLTNSGTTFGIVTYTIIPVANGCNGTPFTIAITVQPIILITNPGPETICSGTSFSRTPTSNITSTTYTWTAAISTAPTSGTITGFSDNAVASSAPITQTLTNSGTTSGIVTYTVTPVANGCNGAPFTFAITVQPTIVITNPGPQTICSGASFSRTPTSNISPTTYTWTATVTSAPTSGTISGFSNNAVASAAPISQTLSNSGITNGVVTYTVTPVANGCNGTPFTIDITVRPTLTASLADPAVICSGAAVAAVTPTSNIAGTTYTWTLGAITGGVTGAAAQASAQAQFSTGNLTNAGAVDGTVTYNITATNAATCNTVNFSIVVTVRPTLTASLA